MSHPNFVFSLHHTSISLGIIIPDYLVVVLAYASSEIHHENTLALATKVLDG
jgi:hypothetical protein